MAPERSRDLVVARTAPARHRSAAEKKECALQLVRETLSENDGPRPHILIRAVRIGRPGSRDGHALPKGGEIGHGRAEPADAAAHEKIAMEIDRRLERRA